MLTFSKMLDITGLSKSDVARILGIVPSSITSRINGTDDIKLSELEKIEEYVGHKIYRIDGAQDTDQIKIPYLDIEGVKVKHPFVKDYVKFDKKFAKNIWGKEPSNLRIMTMQGNNMNFGEYSIKNNDVLIIDISITKYSKPGIYVYTSARNSGLTVSGLQEKADGSLVMLNYNKEYVDEEYTPEQLKAMGFKVIGRMIKNMSLTK